MAILAKKFSKQIGKKTKISAVAGFSDSPFKTSRPFVYIFYMGKRTGSFLFSNRSLKLKKENAMKKNKKEFCPKCGKEKTKKTGTGAFGNKKRKICPKNCRPARGWGN